MVYDEKGQRLLTVKETTNELKAIADRQFLADLFCEFYEAITGEKAKIKVRLSHNYQYKLEKKEAE